MMLKIENLSFCYRKKSSDVLFEVNLEFDKGEVVGLLGPNGAGKSTLLYLISGLLTPTKGMVTFNNISTRKRKPSVLSEIFIVPEEFDLPRISLREYIDFYFRFYPHFNRDVMEEALREFEIIDPGRLDTLSMGQKKKILVSFAFACNTAVTLMDEPTNGLDIPGKAAFRRLVAKLANDERLFLISTHQIRDLDAILDRVAIMDNSNIVFNESIASIQKKFTFVSRSDNVPANAIYSIPSIGGADYMIPNNTDTDSEVNLEILFNAVLQNLVK